MFVTAVKTSSITTNDRSMTAVLDQDLSDMKENSVLVISSKVVALCEGNVVPIDTTTKNELAMKEADLYLPPTEHSYNKVIAINHNMLVISAGVDSRNSNGQFVLLPKDPFASAQTIWKYLKKRFSLKHVGVIIADSHTTPLRKGVVGVSVGYCGFVGANMNREQHDVFGERMSGPVNVADALAASAVYVMGESNEQTPLALISDIPHIQFADKPPSSEEIAQTYLTLEGDIYAPLLTSVQWQKGRK